MVVRSFLLAVAVAASAKGAPIASAAPPKHGAPPAKSTPAPSSTASAASARPESHRVTLAEIDRLSREAIATSNAKLPKGATVSSVRSTAALDVPNAPSRVTIDVATPARRLGPVTTTAILTYWKDTTIAARVPLALELDVPPDAFSFDVPKGATVVLVVKRGLLEISAPAVTAADADVGDVVQVLLRPSGRAVRAKVVAKDRVMAVEDPR